MKALLDLKATANKLSKELILRDLSNIDKQVFYYAYNPYYTYYLNFSVIDWYNLGEPTKEMFSLLNQLKDRKITGNEARKAVEDFAFKNGDLIKLICNKHLECGVSTTLFNSVYSNFIPVFKVQLANDFHKVKPKFPYIAQIKFDGVRVICVFRNGKLTLFSRNGKAIYLPTFCSKNYNTYMNGVLDGEITFKDGLQIDRPALAGKINSAIQGSIIDDSDLIINVFDYLDLEEFESTFCSKIYAERYKKATEFLLFLKSSKFKLAETWEVSDMKELNNLFTNTINQGQEGLMLKKWDSLYSFKRSNAWLKLKPVLDADLTCVDVIEGEGKYKGMVGALACEGFVDGAFVKVKVGSGLTDMDRQLPFDYYLNKTITVRYTHIIMNETGEYSLFAPRFIEVRFDK